MHRPAQRDHRDQHDEGVQRVQEVQGGLGTGRTGRQGARLRRLLVCAAAVPAVLVAAGCSSDSGSGSGSDTKPQAQKQHTADAQPSQSASTNTVQPAAYTSLPKPCAVLSDKTLSDLVPKDKSGKQGTSDDAGTRSSCSWSSLENNGVKGSQFRWLNVSLLRFASDAARGSGNKLAEDYYGRQIQDAQSVDSAKNVKSAPVAGAGDEATAVRYDLTKKEGAFKQETIVARVENVVVTLDYNGAGLAGDKTPDADDLAKAAEQAVKEVVSSVSAANHGGGKGGSGQGGSKSASPSKGASASPSKSASPSASASKKS
ncbi:DUF3558 domain-containing protein [Streptomyces gibsoniae]|uniref:DUF3558 domain-containing protein n=1 Tax=Streptomyces gibsoniae TaxID=3075529 RepID=A0ABU2TYQ7_9ACTN|nr:DUF3558 domain-containing protein [Streptomyces sp. DSM 41699]MDT0466015.1 DUF3558 domain-containing protein [Streptomyces sp. DSM 41699]